MNGARPGELAIAGEHGAGLLRLFAIFWNLVSWPLALAFIFGSQRFSAWLLLIALFPLGGLILGWKAWQARQAQQRIGKPVLLLQAAALGQPLWGTIRFDPPFASRAGVAQGSHQVSVQVQYMLDASLGEDTHLSAAWQSAAARFELASGSRELKFAIDLPPELPPTAEGEFNLTYWQVVLTALESKVGFKLPQDAIVVASTASSGQ